MEKGDFRLTTLTIDTWFDGIVGIINREQRSVCVQNQHLFPPKKVWQSMCTIEQHHCVWHDNKGCVWEVSFWLHPSFNLAKTSPFDNGKQYDFIIVKLLLRTPSDKKKHLPPVLNSYKKFLQHLPRSFFTRLFIGITLGQWLKMATDLKMLPKGLQDQEVERGSPKRPPIPCIPVEYDIGEQVRSLREEQRASKLSCPMRLESPTSFGMVAAMKLELLWP